MAYSTRSSSNNDFLDSDSEYKPRFKNGKSLRAARSNTNGVVNDRLQRMKQKKYVKDLELEIIRINLMINDMKSNRGSNSQHCAQQVAHLYEMLAKNQQVFSWIHNTLWTYCIIPQDTLNMTLNELNSEINNDPECSVANTPRQFDDNFDLSVETDNYYHPLEPSAIELQYDEDWTLFNGILLDLII